MAGGVGNVMVSLGRASQLGFAILLVWRNFDCHLARPSLPPGALGDIASSASPVDTWPSPVSHRRASP